MNWRRFLRDLWLNTILASAILPRAIRRRLLRLSGVSIEEWCAIMPNCWFGGTNVSIGHMSTVNYGVFFDTSERIEIGRDCSIGMQTMLCTGTHAIGDPNHRAGASIAAPIVVGDGVWIGTRATVLPGVTIGAGCVIAAGTVVASDCSPHGLYAGVPARRIRDLDLDERSAQQ